MACIEGDYLTPSGAYRQKMGEGAIMGGLFLFSTLELPRTRKGKKERKNGEQGKKGKKGKREEFFRNV